MSLYFVLISSFIIFFASNDWTRCFGDNDIWLKCLFWKNSYFSPHVPWTVDLCVPRRPLSVHQAVWHPLLILSLFDNQGIIPWFQSIEASFLKELSQVEEVVYLTDRPTWLKSRFLTGNILLLLIFFFKPKQCIVILTRYSEQSVGIIF